jgi:hypothetical protein
MEDKGGAAAQVDTNGFMFDREALPLKLRGIDDKLDVSLAQGVTMKSPMPYPKIVPDSENQSPPPSLRSVVRKSVLLNIVIVLTSAPVLIFEGGPKAVVVTLEIMAGISVLIWSATFALFSLGTLPWIFRTPGSSGTHRDSSDPTEDPGVADRGIDELS